MPVFASLMNELPIGNGIVAVRAQVKGCGGLFGGELGLSSHIEHSSLHHDPCHSVLRP